MARTFDRLLTAAGLAAIIVAGSVAEGGNDPLCTLYFEGMESGAPGWTSLSIVLSLLFSANFGVMAAICLGLLQIIRQSTPDPVELFTTELSGGDLFQRGDRLNVEGAEEDSLIKRGENG